MIALSSAIPPVPDPKPEPRRARRDSSAPLLVEPEASAPFELRAPRGTPAAGLPRVAVTRGRGGTDS